MRPDSPLQDARALFEGLRKDPKAYSVSIGSTPGGTSHIALGRAVRSLGIDPKHAQASAHLETQYEQTRAGLVDLGLAK